jgi:hypothetical protein
MPNYEQLTLDELLNLAQDRNDLTDDARTALDLEIAKRKVTAEEMQSYARASIADARVKERRTERTRFFYETRNKQFFGKKNRYVDPRHRIEEFDTTLWFVLLIPLIPLASYRIRRLFSRWWMVCVPGKLHILETRPRDWQQIRLTWGKIAAFLVAIILILEVAARRQ